MLNTVFTFAILPHDYTIVTDQDLDALVVSEVVDLIFTNIY